MTDAQFKKITKKLNNHEKRISELENSREIRIENSGKKISIKEFILSKKPANDVQKTRVIGYYFEKYNNYLSFNEKDLQKGFRAAKEKIPKNVGDKVQKNIAQGYMMGTEEKKDSMKAWVLTNSGEKNIENNFKKEK